MKQPQQIDLIFEGFEHTGNIYISNYLAAKNIQNLKKLNIQAVITAARGLLLPHKKQQLPNYLYLPIDDNEDQQLNKFFATVFDFIDKNRNRTNVLVHCFSGISRSSALIIGYLIKKYGYSVNKSLLLLKKKRKRIKPNQSFIRQLESYQAQIYQQKMAKLRLQNNHGHLNKKMELIKGLNDIKSLGKTIETKIGQVQEKLLDSQRRKRSNSEYLKQKKMQKAKSVKSRQGSIRDQTPKRSLKFFQQNLKGPSSFRSNLS